MSWFKHITGFAERSYSETQKFLSIKDGFLYAKEKNTGYKIGQFELLSLRNLRAQIKALDLTIGPSSLDIAIGDIQDFHLETQNNGALFQVASQFNCLEMISPIVSPEDGVTRYAYDKTQGPACAIAAGAGTIYRNYLIPHNKTLGQNIINQIDCTHELRKKLAEDMQCSPEKLWTMQNGYAMFNKKNLALLDTHLLNLSEKKLDKYIELLEIGIQWEASVTLPPTPINQTVSQVFSSTLPVAYHNFDSIYWQRIASLILQSTYESTLLAAVINRKKTKNNKVFLTLVGGGAFGNNREWIYKAIHRAVKIVKSAALSIDLVCYHSPDNELKQFIKNLKTEIAQN